MIGETHGNRLDADEVLAVAQTRTEDIAVYLFGQPRASGRNVLRWGRKGSKAAHIAGPKAGLICDWEAGVHGATNLWAYYELGLPDAKGGNFPATIESLGQFLGVSPDFRPNEEQRAKRKAEKAARDDAAEVQRRAKREADQTALRTVLKAGQPVKGSIAETYLRGRGITEMPDTRTAVFIPADTLSAKPLQGLYAAAEAKPPAYIDQPALAVYARDASGKITGLQRVLIAPDGSGKAGTGFAKDKPSTGEIGGAYSKLPGDASDPLQICEGPETALSVWQATGRETWAALGGFGSLDPNTLPDGRTIILCRDADTPKSQADDAIRKAFASSTDAGFTTLIATPPNPAKDGWDFNDTLQRDGANAIRAAIATAAPFAPTEPEPPKPAPPKSSKGRNTGAALIPGVPFVRSGPEPMAPFAALQAIGEPLRDFTAQADAYLSGERNTPPQIVLAADPGAGKSFHARQHIAQGNAILAHGDIRFTLPTLALADDAAGHMQTLTSEFNVMRGRLAIDPVSKSPMCWKPDLAKATMDAGLSVGPTICKTTNDDGSVSKCQHFGQCPWTRQFEMPEQGRVRFGSHNYLTTPDPADRDIAADIIDESIWRLLTKKSDLRAEALNEPRAADGFAEASADLQIASKDLREALETGAPIVDWMKGKGWTASNIETFAKVEAARIVQPSIMPGMTEAESIKRMADYPTSQSKEARLLRRLWLILREVWDQPTSERIRFLRNVPGPGGSGPRNVIRLLWRTAPKKATPSLLLDADASPQIMKRFFPNADFREVRMKNNAEVIQISDRMCSKNQLLGNSTPRTQKKAKNLRNDLMQAIKREVWRDKLNTGGGVLACATKKVVRAFFEDAGMLKGMTAAEADEFMRQTPLHGARWLWFGPAALGVNEFEDFGTAFIIGREEMAVDDLEDLGRAIAGDTGDNLQFVEPDIAGRKFMPDTAVPYEMADGSQWGVNVPCHPDPLIRELQEQIRERNTRQIAERLRLARAAKPKRVVIACKIPIPGLAVTELVAWDDFLPDRLSSAILEVTSRDGMTSAGLRLSGKGLAADAPLTFTTENAADHWIKRNKHVLGAGPIIEHIIIGVAPKSPLVTFARIKLKGVRGRFATPALIFAPRDQAREVATALWGELSSFEFVETGGQEIPKPPETTAAPVASVLTEEAEERAAIIEADGVPRVQAEWMATREMQRVQSPSTMINLDAHPPPAAGSGEWIAAINLDTRR